MGQVMKWTKGLIALALFVSLPQMCCAQVHAHKSDSDVARMTPEQRVQEYCTELFRHGLWHREYMSLLDDSIMRDGLKGVPAMVDVIDKFDPANVRTSGRGRDDQSYAAEILLGGLDTGYFRLRAFQEGKAAIDAVRRVVERMRAAHYESAPDEGERSKKLRYEISLGILKDLEGINDYDRALRDTMELRHKIKLSDNELLDFCNYLVARNPNYPSWSEPDWYRDHNRINDAGNPAQYRILQNIEPFYEAYQKFKQKLR
jgi:hypothetical protein